jgi:hypothetical protein
LDFFCDHKSQQVKIKLKKKKQTVHHWSISHFAERNSTKKSLQTWPRLSHTF